MPEPPEQAAWDQDRSRLQTALGELGSLRRSPKAPAPEQMPPLQLLPGNFLETLDWGDEPAQPVAQSAADLPAAAPPASAFTSVFQDPDEGVPVPPSPAVPSAKERATSTTEQVLDEFNWE